MSSSEISDANQIRQKHGTTIIILALASIFIWLFISDGYDPRLGGPTSFYYTMYIHHSEWFCHPADNILQSFPPPDPVCSNLILYTKHAILISFLGAVYGLLVRMLLVADPISWVQQTMNRRKKSREEGTNEPHA